MRPRNVIAMFAVLFLLESACQAQYPYPPNPYGGFNPGRYGGMLYGTAAVTSAQGDVMVQAEQARIAREQANQAKLVTKRKAFDEAMYEKANTPTYAETKMAADQGIFQRVMMNPTSIEVTTGRAMNIMLPPLDRMALQGIYGAPVPLNPAILKAVNITIPGKTGLGIVGKVNDIPWPYGLLGPTQEKLQTSLEGAVASVQRTGRIEPKYYDQCTIGVKNLSAELDKKFDEEKINMSRYAEASTFMNNLTKEVSALADPTAAKMLGPAMHPQANDVLDLVAFMTSQGLQFAPCRPGDEAAYFSLHSSMSSFAQTSQVASTGLRSQSTSPSMAPSQGKK